MDLDLNIQSVSLGSLRLTWTGIVAQADGVKYIPDAQSLSDFTTQLCGHWVCFLLKLSDKP